MSFEIPKGNKRPAGPYLFWGFAPEGGKTKNAAKKAHARRLEEK